MGNLIIIRTHLKRIPLYPIFCQKWATGYFLDWCLLHSESGKVPHLGIMKILYPWKKPAIISGCSKIILQQQRNLFSRYLQSDWFPTLLLGTVTPLLLSSQSSPHQILPHTSDFSLLGLLLHISDLCCHKRLHPDLHPDPICVLPILHYCANS